MTTSRRQRYVHSVTDLDNGPLYCHAYGHAWDPDPVVRQGPVGMEVWTVVLRCASCPKVRTDYVEPGTYVLVDRRYSDALGYRVLEPADRTDYRREAGERSSLRQPGAPGRFGRP